MQTNNTGVCSQCLSHTGPVATHGVCALPAYAAQALGLSAGNRPRLALGCMHLPCSTSKPLRFRHSGSPQRCILGWAYVLCPSQVRAAQVMRFSARAVTVTYCLPHPCCLVFFSFFFFKFYFIFKLYITVLDLPNIKMNPPQVYMCSPS